MHSVRGTPMELNQTQRAKCSRLARTIRRPRCTLGYRYISSKALNAWPDVTVISEVPVQKFVPFHSRLSRHVREDKRHLGSQWKVSTSHESESEVYRRVGIF